MEQMDRATVVTIHGFCSELLRSHPVEAGVDPGFTVDDGQHAERLRREEWERFTERELGPRAERAERWTEILDEISLGALESLAYEIAEFDIPRRMLRAPFALPDALELLGAEIEGLAAGSGSILERQKGLSPRAVEYFEGMKGALGALLGGGIEAFHRQAKLESDLVDRILGGNYPKGAWKRVSGPTPEEVNELARSSCKLAR